MNLGPIVCRADGDLDIGFGHVLRCINLVSQIPTERKPVLVTRLNAATAALAEAAGWTTVDVPADADDAAEASLALDAARELNARIIVTDLGHRNMLADDARLAEYHHYLRMRRGPLVLGIEDCRGSRFASDIAVVPYECGSLAPAEPGCTVLAGLAYAILNPDIAAAARQPRALRSEADRILVCIGGADPLRLTAKVTRALATFGNRDLEVRVLVGPGGDEQVRAELAEICGTLNGAEIFSFGNDYSKLLLWADVLISGEGLIRFDAAATGTPSLIITQFDHDSELIRRYLALGAAHLIGPAEELTPQRIARDAIELLADVGRRRRQSQRGKELVDGEGPDRIAAAVRLRLRVAGAS